MVCSNCYMQDLKCIVKDRSAVQDYCPFKRMTIKSDRFMLIQDSAKPDDKDLVIADASIKMYNNRNEIRTGDYIKINGKYFTISYIWRDENDKPESIQFSAGGSMHISENGYASFSGSLNPGLKINDLKLTDETKENIFWFFHHNWSQASNAIKLKFPVRVYVYTGDKEVTIY